MPTSILLANGLIKVPAAVRTALGVKPGDRLSFVESGEGYMLVAVKGDARVFKGRFAGRGKGVMSIQVMNDAVSKAVTERALNTSDPETRTG